MKSRIAVLFAVVAATAVLVPGLALSRKDDRGTLTGHVSITGADGSAKKARGGVVVAVIGAKGGPRKNALATYEMRQKDKQFDPQVLVVPKGATVSFPNEDKIFHNVFSLSPTARFDLGLYKAGTAKSVQMKREGEIDVYCNIHPDMVAKIKVLDTPFYAVTEPDGSFHIDNLPAGTYPVEAWYAHGDAWHGEVTITAGGQVTVDPAVVESDRSAHTRKDGTPYGRYK